jgi:predicted aminopeptidase
MTSRALGVALAGLLCVLGSGCFTAGYLVQAAGGQYELLHAARPLRVAIDDPATPPHVRALLAKVAAIKRFGQLKGLTPTQNYTHYADLHRAAAVWVVQGAPKLSLQPRRWDFPIVGSVPYLGFFTEAAARDFARQLAHDEPLLDVTVRTAGAYSTLGWFRDPVLSTMIPQGPEAFGELVNVVLHESVHATVYVPSQSSFNESLASFIADGLTYELVVGRAGPNSPEARAYLAGEERGQQFSLEFHRTYEALDALYRSSGDDETKLARKRELFEELSRRLGLRRVLNNADLAGSRTYATGRDAFERLRRACGGWRGMLEAVRTLREDDFERAQQAEYDAVIDALAARACVAR